MRKAAVAALVAALVAPAAQADEGVAFATLENGASIGFALVRTGAAATGGAIGEAALPRSNTVSRVLWDRASGAYFGYRVEVDRRDGARPFRVAIKPLDRGSVERALRERGDCPGCPRPRRSAPGPSSPPPSSSARARRSRSSCCPTPRPASASSTWCACRPPRCARRRCARRRRACSRGSRPWPAREPWSRAGATRSPPRSIAAPSRFSRPTPASTTSSASATSACRTRRWPVASTSGRSSCGRRTPRCGTTCGTLEQSRKRFKAAVRAYKKAIEIKPCAPRRHGRTSATRTSRSGGCRKPSRRTRRPSASTRRSSRTRRPRFPPPASTPPRSTCSSRSCSPARDRPTPRSTSSRAPRRPASATSARVEEDADFRAVVADPRWRTLRRREVARISSGLPRNKGQVRTRRM